LKTKSLVLAAVVLLALSGCSSTTLDLPAVTAQATGTRLPGKVIWHDLVTADPAAAQRFYGGLFGWTFKPFGGDYTLIMHQGEVIGGMVDARIFKRQVNLSQWVIALSVADLDRALATVRQAGGAVLGGPAEAGARGRLAVVRDPQGATVTLLQTRDSDPLDREAAVGDFMWHELWTSNPAAATAFYRQLASYTSGYHALADGSRYGYLQSDGRPRAAIIANPLPGLAPTWVGYVKVADADATSARVPGLGGTILLPSQASKVGGELAVIADPTGAGLIIQTWNAEQQEH
jgi:predicted enzyme related to lactoylglutathione lyase